MPSPFPGIDPYLESQGYWPDFHASLTTYCRDALNDVLPESYEARLGEQLRLVERREPQGTGRSSPMSAARAHARAGHDRFAGRGNRGGARPLDRDPPSARPRSRHGHRDPLANEQAGRVLLAVSNQAPVLDPPERPSGRARFAGPRSAAADRARVARRRFFRVRLPGGSPLEVRGLCLVGSPLFTEHPDSPSITRSRRRSGTPRHLRSRLRSRPLRPGWTTPHRWICPWLPSTVPGPRSTPAPSRP